MSRRLIDKMLRSGVEFGGLVGLCRAHRELLKGRVCEAYGRYAVVASNPLARGWVEGLQKTWIQLLPHDPMRRKGS